MKMCSSGGPNYVMLPMWRVECSKALVHYVVDHYAVIQGLQGGCRYLRKAAYRIFVVQRASE